MSIVRRTGGGEGWSKRTNRRRTTDEAVNVYNEFHSEGILMSSAEETTTMHSKALSSEAMISQYQKDLVHSRRVYNQTSPSKTSDDEETEEDEDSREKTLDKRREKTHANDTNKRIVPPNDEQTKNGAEIINGKRTKKPPQRKQKEDQIIQQALNLQQRQARSPERKRKKEITESKRQDSSLSMLTQKFIELVRDAPERIVDLNEAASTLAVQKRRLYDITNVLEGIGLIEKKSKNKIQWKGDGFSTPEETEMLQRDISQLMRAERDLDASIQEMQNRLRLMANQPENLSNAFVSVDDVRALSLLQDQSLMVIKAPSGTVLEVPDPDEGMASGKRRYEISLKSKNGAIDVFLLENDEGWGVEHAVSSSQDTNVNPLEPNQDVSMACPSDALFSPTHYSHLGPNDHPGLFVLSPPRAMEESYYLSTMEPNEGIIDLYKTQLDDVWETPTKQVELA